MNDAKTEPKWSKADAQAFVDAVRGAALGYFVLVKSPYHDEAPWESDWDGELYDSFTDAHESARHAAVAGYRAVACALVPRTDIQEPAQVIEPHEFRDGSGEFECSTCGNGPAGPWHETRPAIASP